MMRLTNHFDVDVDFSLDALFATESDEVVDDSQVPIGTADLSTGLSTSLYADIAIYAVGSAHLSAFPLAILNAL